MVTHLSQKEQSTGTLAGQLITQPLPIMEGGAMELQFLGRVGGYRSGVRWGQ